ncbi:MAG: hypothetical protein Ct9H300mP1_03820 [Planctomycetaceae bacterium]|nr:MAG: hypothetical protein Ct9H300mP1_03820 [Planctomycetaceae bacterium]
MAMMSSKQSGRILVNRSRMPALSSWKMPLVSPRLGQRVGRLVVERQFDRVDLGPCVELTFLTVLSRMERLRSPRKSIFNRPACSTSLSRHWVITSSLPVILWRGTYFSRASLPITTPGPRVCQRWGPALETNCDGSSRLIWGSALYCSSGSGLSSSACSMVMPRCRAPSWRSRRPGKAEHPGPADIPDGRLGLQVPKVPIWATLPRRISPWCSRSPVAGGHAEVDVDIGRLVSTRVQEPLEQQVVLQWADVAESQQESDQDPQADPRAWQGMSSSIAKRTKSHTIRK